MIRLISLDKIEFPELTRCFNEAFADYVVKFEADQDYLRNRWNSARADYGRSVGIEAEGKLIGFMVIGMDKWEGRPTAFNAGTGIIPKYRGQGLLGKMYRHLLTELKDTDYTHHMLEVIASNAPAIRAYEKVGFQKGRKLHCFRREAPPALPLRDDFLLPASSEANWAEYRALSEFDWSWDCSEAAMKLLGERTRIGEYRVDGQLKAFAIADLSKKRLFQFGAEEGFEDELRDLVDRLLDGLPGISCVNIAANARRSLKWIRHFGFSPSVDQWEMNMKI